MDAMEEINHSTHDEYGLKAKGILAAMEKFDTLFGLQVTSSTMTEKRLNNCIHVHKDLTDQLNVTNIAKEFISANSDHDCFGSLSA